jgi:ABC-type polar amino acid transport system ATPase subunit
VVCGPSGSSKSTLIRCISRLEVFQQGQVIVYGVSVHTSSTDIGKLRAEIGRMFQNFNLYPHKSLFQNIALAPRKVRGLSRAAAGDIGLALLDKVGMREKAPSYPIQLS